MTYRFLSGCLLAAAIAALAAPTLQVKAVNTECDLSWNSVSGANGYDVYRNGNWIKYTTSTSFANTGLTNGTKYSYTVDAQNDTTSPITVSPQSAAVSCTPGGTTSSGSYQIIGYYL